MQIKQLRLVGKGKEDAVVKFYPGCNVISGASDTGKSYIVSCIDYLLGGEKLDKNIEEAQGYQKLFLELENDGKHLTLERGINQNELIAYRIAFDKIETVASERISISGKSKKLEDITSIVFKFMGLEDNIRLRKNSYGETVRLSIRVLLPAFIVNENAIIDEKSPIYGPSGFSYTQSQRMLNYMLTGRDDRNITLVEKSEVVEERIRAKLDLMQKLLHSAESSLKGEKAISINNMILKLEKEGNRIKSLLEENGKKRQLIMESKEEVTVKLWKSESQIIAMSQLVNRYELLSDRYKSDLKRLDFMSEGVHFFDSLQQVNCPLCEAVLNKDHKHFNKIAPREDFQAAIKSEVLKIKSLNHDLIEAWDTINKRLAELEKAKSESESIINSLNKELDIHVTPSFNELREASNKIESERIKYEKFKQNLIQIASLEKVKSELLEELEMPKPAKTSWGKVDEQSLGLLCQEIENTLDNWLWKTKARVEFIQDKKFDISISGKHRHSHGKGYRAILHSAFTISLLRFCIKHSKPHPGFILIDSPLTTFKEGAEGKAEKIDPEIETAFWRDLSSADKNQQIIIIDNKEPPSDVKDNIHYIYFSGIESKDQNKGFIPPSPPRN